MENQVEKVPFDTNEEEKSAVNTLTVYKKKSTFKGAADDAYWYSATRSDGCSVNCVFKCPIPENLQSAFCISDIKGNFKHKVVEHKGETYDNYTYYITSCTFSDIPSVDLPF